MPRLLVAAGAVVIVGCGTVREARDAQIRALESSARAQEVDLRGASLPVLVEFALTNRPSMVSAALAVKDARLAMREIAADAPLVSSTPWNAASLSGNIGYSESSPATHFEDLGGTKKGKMSASLSLDLLIWDFGRNDAKAKAQAEQVIAAEQQLAEEGYAVFNEVSERFFSLRQADALLAVAQTNVVKCAEHLAQAEDMLSEGVAKELDVMRARLDLAKANETLVSASNDVTTAGANLIAALGLDADAGDVDSIIGEREVSIEPNEAPPYFSKTSFTVETAFDVALTNAPVMTIARAKVRSASAQVDAAIADLYPEISASLSLNWTDPTWYWKWGVNVIEQIFTAGKRTTAIERAVVSMESAHVNENDERQKLSNSIALAVAERDSASEALAAAEVTVSEAKDNLQLVEEQFELGEVSRIELTDAQADYVSALGSRVKAFCRGQIAEAKLFELLGILPFPVAAEQRDEALGHSLLPDLEI